MLKTETSRSMLNTVESTNSGTSSMLMNGRENQLRDNSMRSSVSMLKEISTLFLNYQKTDTLILSTTETWLLRHQMEERLKSGISINNL